MVLKPAIEAVEASDVNKSANSVLVDAELPALPARLAGGPRRPLSEEKKNK